MLAVCAEVSVVLSSLRPGASGAVLWALWRAIVLAATGSAELCRREVVRGWQARRLGLPKALPLGYWKLSHKRIIHPERIIHLT